MNRLNRIVALSGCFLVVICLAGCPKARTEPFDVPSGISHGVPSAPSSGTADQAAATIAAAKVLFAFDRADLRPDARATLENVAVLLQNNPSIRICIQGHCDERGGREYNYDLGARRARAVYNYLLGAKVPARQLGMVTFGKSAPLVPGRTEAAYAMNRRAELVILTTCD